METATHAELDALARSATRRTLREIIEQDHQNLILEMRKRNIPWLDISNYLQDKHGVQIRPDYLVQIFVDYRRLESRKANTDIDELISRDRRSLAKIVEEEHKEVIIEMRKRAIFWEDISRYLEEKRGIKVSVPYLIMMHKKWHQVEKGPAERFIPVEIADLINQHRGLIVSQRKTGKTWIKIATSLTEQTGVKISHIDLMRLCKAWFV